MAFNTGISSAVAQYVYTQSNGAVTQPIGGSYLQAYCEFLGVTQPLYNSWLIALCNHFSITEPLNGSYTIALANYYGITYPTGGTWWMALAEAPYVPPFAPFIWNLDTELWEAETREWEWTIPQAPVADFTSDTTTPYSGIPVQFTDTSLYLPTSWLWTFQGGTPLTSTEQNPVVTFTSPGNHTVSLEATNAEGSNTKTIVDYIQVPAVVADFTSDATVVFENTSVIFEDTSIGGPTSWNWTFAGGIPSTSTLQNPTVVYDTPGNYNVTLESSNIGSTDTVVKANYITVNVVPVVADFSGTPTSPIEGDNVVFTDLSTGTPDTWDWTLTGATPDVSTDQNPTVVYNTAGTYSVSLTASKTGATGTEIKVDYITVFTPGVVEPITEFATGLYYQSISNPLSRVEFSNGLLAQKIQTTI